MKKLISILLAFAVIFSLSIPALAVSPTVDTGKTGSLSIYKYDLTTASGDGIDNTSFVVTGERNSETEAALSGYAIQGVKFTYLRVASIGNHVTQPQAGSASVSLLYGMAQNSSTLALLDAIGLSYSDAYSASNGTVYFTADVLFQALSDALANSTATKNMLESYIKANGGTTLAETDATGHTAVDELPLGLYLIVETEVPEDVTCTLDPFFVSLPMTNVDGDAWMYDVTLYPKNETGRPTLEKTVREAQEDTGKTDDYEHSATASIGDTMDYQIVSRLPVITSAASYLTTYTYADTLSKGITYNKSDVEIAFYTDAQLTQEVAAWSQKDDKFAVNYGAAGDGTTMTITMTDAGLQEINTATAVYPQGSVSSGYSQCYMVIRYRCTLNENAVCGDAGNPNTVELKWKRTNTEYYDTLTDDCHIYTYGVDVLKKFVDQDSKDAKANYSKVKFILRNATDNYFVAAERKNGIYYVTDHADKEANATVFTPDAAGKLIIKGLEDDCYYLKETATDSGYTLLAEEVKIEIITEEMDKLCPICGKAFLTASAKVNDKDVTMTDDNSSVHAFVPLTIVNNHKFDLPRTGSTGTWLITIVGVIGMAAAAVVIFLLLRKKKDEA